MKAPREGKTVVKDRVQGDVIIDNSQIDDMILLRSDGSPVYMLAVVVDDHDMGVTHIIRGDDHLNNAARQMQIYNAMGWKLPIYAHIPLIHGPDGKKMSKRHGATGVEEYQALGYSASGMRNYLTRLGWSHGNSEFFNDEDARNWFDLEHIGRSPSRFDFKKLANISSQHIANTEDTDLLLELEGYLKVCNYPALSEPQKITFLLGAYCVKNNTKTLKELYEKSAFILNKRPFLLDEKAKENISPLSVAVVQELTELLQGVNWDRASLETVAEVLTQSHDIKLGELAAPLRVALSGRAVSPSIFDMMLVLGRDETVARLKEHG